LHILIFTFLDSRREDKRFWTAWKQAFPEFSLLLISSWMQFWSVNVDPKYLSFATFSKDLLVTVIQNIPKRCIHTRLIFRIIMCIHLFLGHSV
jgi:hypothetical protein